MYVVCVSYVVLQFRYRYMFLETYNIQPFTREMNIPSLIYVLVIHTEKL